MLHTHISWLFLAGEFAYKIKKPLNLGFLDFSSRELRLKACCDELNLNRRLAPELYLQVLPIIYSKGEYLLGSDLNTPDAIDFCVKMIRFRQSDLFDIRLMDQKFDPEWMDQLAQAIAHFHQFAESSPYIQQFGEPKFLLNHIEECLSTAEKSPQQLSLSLLSTLRQKSRACFDKQFEALQQRQTRFVKNCHGDLHLRNIALYNNQPTPFDCIEFSDEFRMIDTMNDAAFLVMDCDSRERSDLGYRFLSRYLEWSGDYDGLKLLPIYLSYRAAVRGKVACLLEGELIDEHSNDQALQKSHHDAEHYFELSEHYLSEQHQPELFAIGGLSGSGKSHLALAALQQTKALIIRSDATRKRIAHEHRDLYIYSNEMHKLTYRAMLEAAEQALDAGFSVILDATFLYPSSRDDVAELARSHGVPLHFYWLDVDVEMLKARVNQREEHGRDISDANLDVLESQLTGYRRPTEPYIEFISDSDRCPPDKTSIKLP